LVYIFIPMGFPSARSFPARAAPCEPTPSFLPFRVPGPGVDCFTRYVVSSGLLSSGLVLGAPSLSMLARVSRFLVQISFSSGHWSPETYARHFWRPFHFFFRALRTRPLGLYLTSGCSSSFPSCKLACTFSLIFLYFSSLAPYLSYRACRSLLEHPHPESPVDEVPCFSFRLFGAHGDVKLLTLDCSGLARPRDFL